GAPIPAIGGRRASNPERPAYSTPRDTAQRSQSSSSAVRGKRAARRAALLETSRLADSGAHENACGTGARHMQAAGVCRLARRQCGAWMSDRGERDRAAGIALTIQIVAKHSPRRRVADASYVAKASRPTSRSGGPKQPLPPDG